MRLLIVGVVVCAASWALVGCSTSPSGGGIENGCNDGDFFCTRPKQYSQKPAAPATGAPAASTAAPVAKQPWARRISRPGLGNLAQVSDNLYRGAKPSGRGFEELKSMGVRTVIDLGHWFFEVDNLRDRQLRYVRIDFYTWQPRDNQVVRFLQVASNKDNGPVYVHCRRGADRTGFMVAIYRVVCQGWSREQAIAEMTGGGFGFDPQYQNLVSYVRTRDLEGLGRQAGIAPQGPAVAQGSPAGAFTLARVGNGS